MEEFEICYHINGTDFSIMIKADTEEEAIERAYETFDGFYVK